MPSNALYKCFEKHLVDETIGNRNSTGGLKVLFRKCPESKLPLNMPSLLQTGIVRSKCDATEAQRKEVLNGS